MKLLDLFSDNGKIYFRCYTQKEELQYIPKIYNVYKRAYLLPSIYNIPFLLSLFDRDEVYIDNSFKEFQKFFEQHLRTLYLIKEGYKKVSREELGIAGLKNPELVRDYQLTAITFAYTKKRVLIADEMGLGKSLVTIASTLLAKKNDGIKNVLIVCPNSVKKSVWEKEIKNWTNESCYIYDATNKNKKPLNELLEENFYTVINYESLRTKYTEVKDRIGCIVLDECHYIKNRRSQQTRAVKSLKSDFLLLLSGTPILNRVNELWSLMDYIDSGLFGKYWKFVERYCKVKDRYIGKGRKVLEITGNKNVNELKERIYPYYIRRTKDEVLNELPERVYKDYVVNLHPTQIEIYNGIINQLKNDITKSRVKVDKLFVKSSLIRLLRVCDTTYGFINEDISSKFDLCIDILKRTVDEHKIVIFTWFIESARLLKKRVEEVGIKCVQIDGETKVEERDKLIKQFHNEDDCRVLIATIATCGLGVDLQVADVCIFISRSFVPAMNDQAESRLHRMGQKKMVNVINIISDTYAERRVFEILKTKKDIFTEVFEEGLENLFVEV